MRINIPCHYTESMPTSPCNASGVFTSLVTVASVTTGASRKALLRFSLSGQRIRRKPNKLDPRSTASSGCYPLSAFIASDRESFLSSGATLSSLRPRRMRWNSARRVKIGTARMGFNSCDPKSRAGRERQVLGSIRDRGTACKITPDQGEAAASSTGTGGTVQNSS